MEIDNTLDETRVRYKIRRGMLELDLLFKQFVDHHYVGLSHSQKVVFSQLLELEDPELYRYFFQSGAAATNELAVMIELIRNATTS